MGLHTVRLSWRWNTSICWKVRRWVLPVLHICSWASLFYYFLLFFICLIIYKSFENAASQVWRGIIQSSAVPRSLEWHTQSTPDAGMARPSSALEVSPRPTAASPFWLYLCQPAPNISFHPSLYLKDCLSLYALSLSSTCGSFSPELSDIF